MKNSKLDSAKRLKYIRLLERFNSSILAWLAKSAEPTKDEYNKRVAQNFRFLENFESVELYKDNYNSLESLAQKILDFASSTKEIDEIKNELFYIQNQLEKSKNSRKYKKSKYNSNMNDGY